MKREVISWIWIGAANNNNSAPTKKGAKSSKGWAAKKAKETKSNKSMDFFRYTFSGNVPFA
jgi:hypothetical protein